MAAKRQKAAAPARPAGVRDGLENLLTGMGTSVDKFAHVQYSSNFVVDKNQLELGYRGDWLSRKIIDIPASDNTREWRSWQADKEDVTKLEAAERALNLRQKLKRAMIKARLYGGAALVLGVDQGTPDQPLNLNGVRQGSLKFVHAVSRYDLTAGELDTNIDSPYYGEPSYYQRDTGQQVMRIHPSRVVRLLGAEYPDPMQTNDGWGDSVLQIVSSAVMAAGSVVQGTASMVAEASVDVINMPELLKKVATADGEKKLQRRFQIAAMAKSIYHILLLDDKETWTRVSHNFNSLPDIVRTFLLVVSGAADIPVTRLLNDTPSGLSSTGESDIRNYYDRVRSEQETELTPLLERLDEVFVRSALGGKPDGVTYEWRSLWQMNDEQRAELAKKKADVFKIDVDSGVLDPAVLREARINQLIEDGTYPGLDTIVEEQEALAESGQETAPEPPPAPGAAGAPPALASAPSMAAAAARDAEPRTLYVRRQVLNAADVLRWARQAGFERTLPAEDLHVTIAFSRKPVDWMRAGSEWGENERGEVRVKPGGVRLLERFGDARVLLFASSELSWRHVDIRERTGASWDFEDYQPHITISYESDAREKAEPYRGEIVLGPEIFEEVKVDALEQVEEVDT